MVRIALALVVLALLPSAVRAQETAPDPGSVVAKLKDRDRDTRLAGLAAAREVQDERVTKELVKLVRDRDPEVRRSTVEALRTRRTEADRRRAATALAALLGPLSRDATEAELYELVIAALHDVAHPASVDALLDMDAHEPKETAGARLMAVGNVPDAKAIEALIAYASKGRNRGREGKKELTIKALRYATRTNHGSDPDQWRAWWRDVKDHFDFEMAAEERTKEREKATARERKKEERKNRPDRKRRKKGDDEVPPEDGE